MENNTTATLIQSPPMICLLSSVRNSAKHLQEWFQYHRAIGITHFYVIDHRPSQDETSDILAKQPDAVIIRKTGPFNEVKWSAELCNTAIRDGAQALFPNDTDEFLAGNGAPFRQRVEEILTRLHVDGIPAIHLISPGFNMFPSVDLGDNENWRTHVLARPNPLFTGKSAIFLSPESGHVVTNGCQHRLRLRPDVPAEVRPDSLPNEALSMDPKNFPFWYMHFPFHGPTPFLHRIRTFANGPKDKVWQMATRYGEGIINEERRASGDITDDDLNKFIAYLHDDRHSSGIYKRAVLDAGLPRAYEVRTEIADFFGLVAPRNWSSDLLENSLRSFDGLDRGVGPLTEEEFVLWPVGAMQLRQLEERQQLKSIVRKNV